MALEQFVDHKVLLITGNSGDGKSTLAWYIMSTLSERGSKVVNVTSPEAIEASYNPDDNVLFLVDDAFGTPTMNNQLVEAWIRLHDKLRSFKEGGDFGLILTSRTHVLKSCLVKLESYNIFTDNYFDLCDNDNKLSEKEKRQMLERYCSDKDVSLSVTVYDQIKSSSLSGFPLLCKLHLIIQFFFVTIKTFCEILKFTSKTLFLCLQVLVRGLNLFFSFI